MSSTGWGGGDDFGEQRAELPSCFSNHSGTGKLRGYSIRTGSPVEYLTLPCRGTCVALGEGGGVRKD